MTPMDLPSMRHENCGFRARHIRHAQPNPSGSRKPITVEIQ